MRIISKFNDYYDCIMREGVDLTQVWVREASTFDCDVNGRGLYKNKMKWPFPNCHLVHHHVNREDKWYEWLHIVGFCGKLYPMFEFRRLRDSRGNRVEGEDNPSRYCWSLEEVDAHYCDILSKGGYAKYCKNRWGWSFTTRRKYQEYFEEVKAKEKSLEKLFTEHNTPVFVAREGSWRYPIITFNACLREHNNFITKFDPYQAFQEISMYFGSGLSGSDGHKTKYKGQMIEPEIDDVTKAESKGFDRFSFRSENHPSKPRKKRKRNRNKPL